MQYFNRREFIKFMGGSTAAFMALSLASSCSGAKIKEEAIPEGSELPVMNPSTKDELGLAPGLNSKIFLKEGMSLSGKSFGHDNDFIAFIPTDKLGVEGFLWINHEHFAPLLLHKTSLEDLKKGKTAEHVAKERKVIGGTLLKIKKGKEGTFEIDPSFKVQRIDATTSIPFAWDVPIAGATKAIGMVANCAGGKTPWNTFLSCEENFDLFYGDHLKNGEKTASTHGWEKFHPHSPLHYGWVVEINPQTNQLKKLVALGRFSHESATVTVAPDQRPVVYMGDDSEDEFIYKFIAKSPGSLERGDLYVANTEKGQWLHLDWASSPDLQKSFKDQTEVLIYCREAARILGATPQDRPEDIEVHPTSGAVFVCATNNKPKKNFHGQILKIVEKNNDPRALEFESSVFMMGGEENSFSCPDNMAFDKNGNLWFTTDISGSEIGKGAYKTFGNNGLFFVPMLGAYAGQVFQMASAPVDAEFTGPCFSPDGKVLFLSVQHPGEKTKDISNPTSRWPDGGKTMPKSCVVQIFGPTLELAVEKGLES